MEKLVKHLRSYPLTTWTRSEEISGSWIIAWIIIGQTVNTFDYQCVAMCQMFIPFCLGSFFLQKHTGHGGPLGIQRRAAYPPYSLSQADILGDRMGLNLRRFHKLPGSLSPTFSHYEMMQKEKAKRQTTHKKPIGNIGSDVKVWTFLSSWRIAILHEGRLKCCGEGPQRVCPRLRLDCTWIAHGSSHIHPYPAFDIF